ncbi:MAG TPA: CapA family protein [Spirochaetota bacterium]|nr:CapA family protein [Spirochaetota bacterium]
MKLPLLSLLFCALAFMPVPLRAGQMIISFTGDIMMHNAVKACAAAHDEKDREGNSLNNGGFDYLFESIAPRLRKSDIIVGNLEFPVAAPFTSREIVFNCPPEVLPALKKAGFTMMCLSNNHILDQGVNGAKETLDRVLQEGFDAIGAGINRESAGVIKKSGNLTVGFLACTGIINYPIPSRARSLHINWFYDEDQMKEDIVKMKKIADYVILSVHTGDEYITTPRPEDAALMKRYCDAGADCIIGHHPHMLQPSEPYTAADGRQCRIFYSLGNFLSSYSIDAKKSGTEFLITSDESVVVNLRIRKNPVTKKTSAEFSLLPILIVKDYNESSGIHDIHTVALCDHIKRARKKAPAGREMPGRENGLTVALEKRNIIRSVILGNGRVINISFDD